MAKELVSRALSFTFQLGEGQFGNSGFSQVTVEGVRASVHIDGAGGAAMPTASIRIYGLPQQLMNQLSTLGLVAMTVRRNIVTVNAGIEGQQLTNVFQGTIINAYGDYESAPDVPFVIDAATGYFDAVAVTPPTTFKGQKDVATMLKSLAAQFNPPLSFENNGVNVSLNNPSYSGSPRDQVVQILEDSGVDWNMGANGILAIWPPGTFRTMQAVATVSPDTGMIGYPSFYSNGITVRTIFNPQIFFGSKIKVVSSLPAASQVWAVAGLSLDLEAKMPGGKWEQTIQAAPVGFVVAPSI